MSKINIKGVELEINMLDADQAEKVEKELESVKNKCEKLQANNNMKLSDGIRKTCQIVFDCFNSIFGDGTDKRIFGNRTDMGECMEAFAELAKQTQDSGMQTVQNITSKYSPNRDARRHPAKK